MLSPESRKRWGAAALVVAMLVTGTAAAQLPPLPPLPSEVSATAPFTPIATAYQEDFELGEGGYTVGGNAEWEYGSPASPPEPVPGQGPMMWGTDLDSTYENSACGYLQSAPIDLSGYPAGAATGVSLARLAYRQWMHFENRYDAGLVQASVDGVSWEVITPVGGYTAVPYTSARTCLGLPADGEAYTTPSFPEPAPTAWALAEFDVTAYLGGTLHLRWVFGSDSSVVKRGWYVDDVLVQVGAGASATVGLPSLDGVGEVPFTPLATIYAEDFEASEGGWTGSGTGAWSWGAPVAPPITLVGSLNVWGARLTGPYLPSECSRLTSPAIAIPGASATGARAAMLSFKMWRSLESGYDAAQVEASTDDGATWQRLTPVGGYERALTSSYAASTRACLGVTTSQAVWSGPTTAPRDDEWKDVQVDVTHLMGTNAMFRVSMGSDGDTEYRGAFVDDVLVQLGIGASATGVDPMDASLPNPIWSVWGTNPTWEYGLSQEQSTTLPVWATNLQGAYNNNECSAILSEPIDTNLVPGVGRLELRFSHAFETASSADGGAIQVSDDDGATWRTVTPVGGYNSLLTFEARDCVYGSGTNTPGYSGLVAGSMRPVVVSLTSYVGDTIRIRFVFGSNSVTQDPGWTVGSLQLTRGAASVPLGFQLDETLLSKADPALRGLVGTGADQFRVVVSGKPHEGVADLAFPTRAQYTAWFDGRAAPFLGDLRATVEAAGGELTASWAILPGAAVEVDLQGLLALLAMEDVAHVTLDSDDQLRLVEPLPDDSVGASNTQGRKMLDAEDIWALGFKGAGITLTVIDTGIYPTHEAFKKADGSTRIAAFADCVSGTCSSPTPYDDHGHGTHVAGTSVGSALYNDPTYGFFQETGVAPEATLTVAKFLNGGGSGSFAAAVAALNWSFSVAGADVTSNSWGASGCSSSAYPVMAAVRTLTDAGMLSVFAAGNSGPGSGSIGSPACSESALSVGAVDASYNIASFSSRGPCADNEIGGPSRICPDVVAKGVSVRSAIPRSGAGNSDPTGYKVWQGTSMATPHVAGAVLLAEQMKRFYTGTGWDTAARAEEAVFKMTALDLGAAGEDNTFGWGHPKLLTIYALLDSTDEANIVHSFGISRSTLRQNDATLLTFSVRNLGGAVATGDFLATLTDPSGDVTTLKSTTVSLGLLDGESVSSTFVVTGSAEPGTYTLNGSFVYSWTNSTTGEIVTGEVVRTGTFDVKRVYVRTELDGLDAQTTPGDLQVVTYTATNTGNEDAQNVTIEVTFPDDYVFVPGASFDPTNLNTRYSDPAPSRVVEDRNFGRVTLVFDVGALPQGESFEFSSQFLPTTPGTYRVMSVAKWADGAGNRFSQGSVHTQIVSVP